MATKEDAQDQVSQLRQQLGSSELDYRFLIPGWKPEGVAMGVRWMESQLWEGFNVAYKIDHEQKTVAFKYWEQGEPESEWGSL